MERFLQEAQEMEQELIALRRELHVRAEVADRLPQTVAFVTQRLRELGYEPREICQGGIVAVAGGKKPGKTFLLRADMDALPVKEESGLPFACHNGSAHVCGHDLHTAMLLGAAGLLKRREEELPGTVKLMFQPDEEWLTGGRNMIAAGVLEHPEVDAAMALHVFPGALPAGTLACSNGFVMASSDRFRITVTGRGGHGAMPHNAVDPITAGAHLCCSLPAIPALEVDAREPLILTVTSFHTGSAPNIVPETAVLEGSMRACSPEVRAYGKRRLQEMARCTAEQFRCGCEVAFTGGTAPAINDAALAEELSGYAREVMERVVPFEGVMSSDDFSLICERVPGAYFILGAGGEDPVYRGGALHKPDVRFNENALRYGAALLAHCAYKWLAHHAPADDAEKIGKH